MLPSFCALAAHAVRCIIFWLITLTFLSNNAVIFFVQFNFAKKVVRVPCSGGGDINGNLIGLISVQMLVVGLHAGIFFGSVVCVFVRLPRKH